MTSGVSGVTDTALRDKNHHHHVSTHYSPGAAAVSTVSMVSTDPLRNKLLPITGQVQNLPSSRVYVFGNYDVTEDELNADSKDSIEMSELRPRKLGGKVKNKKKHLPVELETVLIEREIESGDTLQIFALQFGCPVAELKRCNNLINDQDFFALKRIKIPVKQYGLLTENQEEERRRPSKNPDIQQASDNHLMNGDISNENEDTESEYDEEDDLLVRKISIRDCMRDKTTAKQFLRKMDQDLEKICQATQTQKKSLEEVTNTLTEPRIHPLLMPYYQKRKKRTSCDGDSCGLSWMSMVLIVVFVSVALPVLIGMYFLFSKK